MAGAVFPSAEWMRAFCEQVVAHEDAQTAAASLAGVYRFTVEPSGPLTSAFVDAVELTTDTDGRAVAQRVDPTTPPRLGLRADYSTWRRLIQRELDVRVAMLLRRLKISGDLGSLRSAGGSTGPLLEALSRVDTRWPQ